ncbi:tRNA (Guanine37-N(1)-) methyltransferase [Desulfacinum hydrothermale DSM 13146]|uniref:tRNA (guanine-N(1)-)-methyltransferase n=1 Tax=Desulfacinum hydrothermale DSM 13146 TaxID=1121390 RepID=A0A1W1XP92_9BACT|nr:tRNA (guanosine(37)-N1)-methyltransferase TrmD [Desulfacinum hydrothermale]SMC25810.1 tRNA (Guanine37-N(1)-) methyltransferase [Desulfacinum hydrothermale DSM 13146]
MIFDILTIFPGIFESPLRESILGKACQRGLLTVRVHNIRDYALDKHQMTDDRPFGGGEGMVMKPEPIVAALEDVKPLGPDAHVVLLSPQGRSFSQEMARRFRAMERLVLVCGRYEGVDQRVAEHFVDEEVSIGDFILTGGELAALVIVDAVARLLPGVLGNEASPEAESFAEPLLEYPQYTRPREFRGHAVPEVLLSGDHERIRRWRRMQALARTRDRRPDLFQRLELSAEDRRLLDEYDRERP